MFNIILVTEKLEIHDNIISSLIHNDIEEINIIRVKSLEYAKEILSKNKINMLLVSEPNELLYNNEIYFPQKLSFKTSGKILNIYIKDILFIESDKHKCILHTSDNNSISIISSITKVSEKIKNTPLIRCHQSYIINTKNISSIDKSYEPWTVTFSNSDKIAFVSRRYRNVISEIFKYK